MKLFIGSHVEYTKGPKKGSYRKATRKEIAEAKTMFEKRILLEERLINIQTQLSIIQHECPHKVFHDTDGYIYYHRYCSACGIHLSEIQYRRGVEKHVISSGSYPEGRRLQSYLRNQIRK